MRNTLFFFLGVAFLAAAGCQTSEPPPPPGDLAGPTATATVGDHIFVTSPEDDGLRVMAAAGSVASEGCTVDEDCGGGQYCEANLCIRAVEEVLRAPDPLFSLVVPALRAPGILLSLPGAAGERSLLVVGSETDPQLRFVDADADALVPVGLPVPLSGRATGLAYSEQTGELYVLIDAPDLGGGLSAASVVARLLLEDGLRVPAQEFGRAPAVVADLWVLPARGRALAVSEAGGQTSLWVASAEDAELFQLFPADGQQIRVTIAEGLSHLLASPASAFAGGDPVVGARLFGLSASGRALQVFDGADGSVVPELVDGTETLSVPLPGGSSELGVGSDLTLTLPPATGETEGVQVELPWVLIVPQINGDTILVDGLAARTIDNDGDLTVSPSLVSFLPEASDDTAPRIVEIDNPDHDPTDPASLARIPAITLTEGVTRSRTWALAWRPNVPGQSGVLGLLRENGAAVELVPTDPPVDLDSLVRAGDQVEILTHLEVPEGCTSMAGRRFLVESVDAAGGAVVIIPKGSSSLPDVACVTTPLRYQVRASEFLITASGLKEVYRASAGETFTFAGEPFLAGAPAGPDFAADLEAGQTDLEDGATRLIEVSSGADPWRIGSGATLGSGARFPGTPSVYPGREGAPETARVYLPFPGNHAVFAFDLATGAGKTAIR